MGDDQTDTWPIGYRQESMRTKKLLQPLLTLLAVVTLAATPPAAQSPDRPASGAPSISAADAAGHRLWVLLFDMSSMQAADVQRAKIEAVKWINTRMNKDDLVSIVTVSTTLKLLQNFTSRTDRVRGAVGQIKVALEPGSAAAGAGDRDLQEWDFFNNDLRFRGLRTLCTDLQSIEQKKAIILFTAVRERPGSDNQIEVRAATEACQRAHATINPFDVRAAPGGGF